MNKTVDELIRAVGGTQRAANALGLCRRTISNWRSGDVVPSALKLANLKRVARESGWEPRVCDHCGGEIRK
jgi:hypothetical protein